MSERKESEHTNTAIPVHVHNVFHHAANKELWQMNPLASAYIHGCQWTDGCRFCCAERERASERIVSSSRQILSATRLNGQMLSNTSPVHPNLSHKVIPDVKCWFDRWPDTRMHSACFFPLFFYLYLNLRLSLTHKPAFFVYHCILRTMNPNLPMFRLTHIFDLFRRIFCFEFFFVFIFRRWIVSHEQFIPWFFSCCNGTFFAMELFLSWKLSFCCPIFFFGFRIAFLFLGHFQNCFHDICILRKLILYGNWHFHRVRRLFSRTLYLM